MSTRPRSPRRRWRRVVAAALGLVALAVAALWLARDLPRRRAESALGSGFAGEARLGALEVRGRRSFVLRDVVVREPSWAPWLAEVRVARATVAVAADDGTRYDAVVLEGVVARLAPSARPAPAVGAPALRVARLEVTDGRIEFAEEDGGAEAGFTGTLFGVGDDLSGTIHAQAHRVPLRPLLVALGPAADSDGIDGELRGLDGSVTFGAGPRSFTAEVALGGARVVHGELALVLPAVALEADGAPLEDGGTRVTARASMAGIASTTATVELDQALAVRAARGALGGVDAAALLARIDPPPAGWVLEGRFDLEASTAAGDEIEYEAEGTLGRLRAPLAYARVSGDAVRIAARGRVGRAGGLHVVEHEAEATGGRVRVEAGGVALDLEAAGLSWAGTAGAPSRVRARATLAGAQPGAALVAATLPARAVFDGTLAADRVPTLAGRLALDSPTAGRLEGDGSLQLEVPNPRAALRWSWSAARLERLAAAARERGVGWPAQIDASGALEAHGTLAGAPFDPAIDGTLVVEDGSASTAQAPGAAPWTLRGARVSLAFARRPGEAWTQVPALRIEGTLVHAPFEPLAVTLEATGAVAPAPLAARLDAAEARLADLAVLRPTGTWSGGPDGALAGTLGAEFPDLERLRRFLRPWSGDPVPDYRLRGTAGARLEFERPTGGPWAATGRLELVDGGFASEDGARVVEGLAGTWDVSAVGLPGAPTSMTARGRAQGPVVLWDAVFGDFGALAVETDGSAELGAGWRLAVAAHGAHGVSLAAELARAAAGGDASAAVPALDAAIAADVPDLGALLEHWVRIPLEGSVPRLEGLTGAGAARLGLRGTVEERRGTARGELVLAGVEMTSARARSLVRGLDLQLPLDLAWTAPAGGRLTVEGPAIDGSFRFDQLRLGGVDFPALASTLRVAGDTVGLDEPARLRLLHGEMVLERLTLADAAEPERRLSFALRFDGLSLAALSEALGGPPLDGTLHGYFPDVRLSAAGLAAEGGGELSIFGGTLALHGISARDVFSRYPRVVFSADFREIDLLRMTRRFAFGDVQGVAQGTIRDCELVRGLPVRCSASFETVERAGVPRKINVEAIDSIVMLGSGGSIDVFQRGLQRLFRTRTYEKIGVRLELRDDRFVLRGTERRGKRELFVKGRLPLPIDVVNVAPGQSVSFQTMMLRVGNLRVSTARPPDPVD